MDYGTEYRVLFFIVEMRSEEKDCVRGNKGVSATCPLLCVREVQYCTVLLSYPHH